MACSSNTKLQLERYSNIRLFEGEGGGVQVSLSGFSILPNRIDSLLQQNAVVHNAYKMFTLLVFLRYRLEIPLSTEYIVPLSQFAESKILFVVQVLLEMMKCWIVSCSSCDMVFPSN